MLPTNLLSLLPTNVWPLQSSHVWPLLPSNVRSRLPAGMLHSMRSLLPSCMSSKGKKRKIFSRHSSINFFLTQRCKSRELKGSVLITQCECVKRNGLQLDCPRTECHGRPCCTTKPWPSCCPSKYMWRYTNVTMGKATNARPSRSCKPKGSCNPCVIEGPCCDWNFFG